MDDASVDYAGRLAPPTMRAGDNRNGDEHGEDLQIGPFLASQGSDPRVSEII
jgi:hypothetical protein